MNRNFRKLFTALFAIVLVASFLCSCAQPANNAPQPANPVESAPASVPDAPVTYADTISWDAEYDVIVIGFGGAGAVSSIVAADQGASVLLTEKAPLGEEGGNTKVCHQQILYYDDVDGGIKHVTALNEGMNHMTPEVIEFIVRESIANYDWMESVGIPKPEIFQPAAEYPEYPGVNSAWFTSIKDDRFTNGKTYWGNVRLQVTNRSDKIDVWFSSPAQRLIQDPVSKAVIGVQISKEGELLNVRAQNGVVLACGGYENNEEMIENFTNREYLYPIGTKYNTGDGIKMGLDVGADIWHMGSLSGPWLTFKFEGMEHAYFGVTNTQNHAPNKAGIYVGSEGWRFMPESGSHRHGHVSYGGTFYPQINPYPMYLIFDETARTAGSFGSIFSDGLEEELKKGIVVQANTIAELAEKIGVDAYGPAPDEAEESRIQGVFTRQNRKSGLVLQVELYNQYCKEGFDHQYNRDPQTLTPIKTAPYYAIKLEPAIVNTQGGPKRNLESEVLNPYGEPIPHLYSAGELGSIYGGLYVGGGNLSETMFSGRKAGANAAKQKVALPAINQKAVSSNIRDYGSDLGKSTDEIALNAGEYLGKGAGLGGELTVKVKLNGDKIEAVEVVKHSESAGISDPALKKIPLAIVAANSTEVDTVTGATITSKAIIEAVNNALVNIK